MRGWRCCERIRCWTTGGCASSGLGVPFFTGRSKPSAGGGSPARFGWPPPPSPIWGEPLVEPILRRRATSTWVWARASPSLAFPGSSGQIWARDCATARLPSRSSTSRDINRISSSSSGVPMVRFTAVVVCLVTLIATAGAAEAQYFGRNKVRYDHLDFRVLQTEHFDIYYYPEEEEATRHAARMAERWYTRFSQVLHHSFSRRQTLVLYASHPHFGQTNVTPSSPAEGTGGLTERTKSRIAMPFAAGLGATDHVLGHEIAHAFQIDIAKSNGQDAFVLPGWFIEGMAEYLSLGSGDRHTAMWLRDAAVNNRLPTFEQLDDPQYFPYRFGHALWSFLTARYGDDILGQVMRSKARGAIARIREATGQEDDPLLEAWHSSISDDAASTDDERRSSAHRIAA